MHPVIARLPGPGPPGAFAARAGWLAETGGGPAGQARCGAAPVRIFAGGYRKNPALAGLDAAAVAG